VRKVSFYSSTSGPSKLVKKGLGNRGMANLWKRLDHIAIIVSDVGRSLAFYTDVIGLKQVSRPDFDRYRTSGIRRE
jgi:catechol-2,3-dioxygenase